jgi:hypothetical protein
MSQRRAKQERQTARGGQAPESLLRRLVRDRRVWIGAGVLALVAVLGVGVVVARGTGAAEPIAERSGSTVSLSGTDPITGKPLSLDDFAGKPSSSTSGARGAQGASPRRKTSVASPQIIPRSS